MVACEQDGLPVHGAARSGAGVVETEHGLAAYFDTREAAAVWGDPVEVAAQDWSVNWQQSWRPFPLGERWFLAPPWDESPTPANRIRLTMTPGNVFGGGDHPTTQMCLELLEHAVIPGQRVIDIGTGTGILSVAAQALGARAFACDTDLEAVQAAQKAGVTVWQGSTDSCRPTSADLVLANLPGGLLIDLLPSLRRLAPILLVSGYLDDQAPAVEANAQIQAQRARNGWHAALLRYP